MKTNIKDPDLNQTYRIYSGKRVVLKDLYSNGLFSDQKLRSEFEREIKYLLKYHFICEENGELKLTDFGESVAKQYV